MALHQKAFWIMSLWLIGVGVGSFLISLYAAQWIALCFWGFVAGALLLGKNSTRAVFAIVGLIGSLYVLWFNVRTNANLNIISTPITIEGRVLRTGSAEKGQVFDLRTIKEKEELTVRVYARAFPRVRYGDVLIAEGVLRPIEGDAAAYYRKEGIDALLMQPAIQVLRSGEGNKFLSVLFSVRDSIALKIQRFLPSEEATFLTGLLLGKSAGFSKAFKEKLSLTGTTHLVALSGYNVAIMASGIALLCGLFFSYGISFVISIIGIVAFVLMTGAEASVVRAGIMGVILLLAERTSRVYNVRNAIAAAATVMTIINPYVLTFDVGFQLSFVALLGIVYLKPALDWLLKLSPEAGVFGWRAIVTTTLAAQLAVLPIGLLYFEYASIISIIPNVLILVFIPTTMLLGIVLVGLSYVSHIISTVVAFAVRILVGYELAVINLFSKIPIGLHFKVTWVFVGTYYAILLGFIWYFKKRKHDF